MSKYLRYAAAPALALCMMGAIVSGQEYNENILILTQPSIMPGATLVNPWGLSRSSSSPWWVSDNGTGLATLYNGAGTRASLTVTIPAAATGKTGTPTGTIFNGSTTDFLLAASSPALFLFSTLDGLIVAWNSSLGTTAMAVVTTTDGSSYTGLTAATINGKRYLYAANFTKGRVDVYDNTFHPVHLDDERFGGFEEEPFEDHWLPRNYVPFNVQAIGNDIVVTYALHEPGNLMETDGPGLGFVDIYSATGRLLQRLEHGDWLNAPWGVALAPLDFGAFSHDLLVGQFAGGGTTQSSGYIAAYDLASGHFKGLLEDTSGNPLAINGIWAISPGNTSPNNFDSAGAPSGELYFTAGPDAQKNGLFGYLTAVTADLIQGNAQ
jgi:uncharacterized protein (TIGR03118 family)